MMDYPILAFSSIVRGGGYRRSFSYRDLTGYRFGRLVVVEREYRQWRLGTCYGWLCRCDCGRLRFVMPDRLIRGHTVSCGCASSFRPPLCPVIIAVVKDHRLNTKKSTREIGEHFGMTKNSVIGILSRAGMCETPKTPKREPIPDFPPHHLCAFPVGNPGDLGFSWCGQPVWQDRRFQNGSSSYCPHHHSRVYIDESIPKEKRPSSIGTADFPKARISRKAA